MRKLLKFKIMKNILFKIIIATLIVLGYSSHLFAQINTMKHSTAIQTNLAQPASMIKEGVYFIKINESNKYLSIENNSNENGAKLLQWDLAKQDNQKFEISRTADGYYLLKAINSNKFLNVSGQSTEDGTIISQWDFVNQDNLKWSFYYNKFSNSYVIKNKQSNKQLQLRTNLNDANNGVFLCISGNPTAQTFLLQDVNDPSLSSRPKAVVAPALLTTVQVRMADGSIINRTINPKVISIKNETSKKIIQTQGDGDCVTKTAKIDMNTQDFIPVTASTYLEYNAPGLIYDMRNFYSGDYSNKQFAPYGENRNPISIVTSVKNMEGNIFEPVDQPTLKTINQAIKDLQVRYTTDPLQTTNQSLIYRSSLVESNTELQLKLGASAYYMGGSFSADMKIKNSRETKTFYIEAEKELFTLSAYKPQNGFFNTDIPNISNLGYISQVSYGVKVIGKIEVDNSQESLDTDIQAMINGGFAGGKFEFGSFSQKTHKNMRFFFYVVGGVSQEVTGATLSDIYYKVNQILSTINYKTCMPIRIKFSQLTTGNTIIYKDATNNFNYEICTPKAIAEANKNYSISINSLMAMGTDVQLYGWMWVELWSPTYGDLKRYRTTNNLLFSIGSKEHLNYMDLSSYSSYPEVMYKNIPPEMTKDAEVHIYYNLWDYDEIGSNSDDLLRLRSGDLFTTKTITLPTGTFPSEQFYRRVIPVRNFSGKPGGRINMVDDLVDGDGVKITYNCTESLFQN